MSRGYAGYWLLTGAALGFGFIGILSIGLPFIALGLGMIVFGAVRRWGRGLWALLVGFGGLPALILLWDVFSAPWACMTNSGYSSGVSTSTSSQTSMSYYTCVDTPVGPLTTYHVLAMGFGVIALAGLAWPLLRRLWARSRGAA
ncbi:MAG: hypothetical protein OJF49_003186 [Ktedonobacterales bacterium]|jgi:hypothetical protein|nr:MAG: hypothetical protein OJF49_003186 [Ktedonobacterales bacterium]